MFNNTKDFPDIFGPVFSSYLSNLPRIRGKLDSETRAPTVFREVWGRLGLVPSADRVILITGSKGKGTVARLIAWNLQRRGYRVGLVVTPEELSHLDRIRLDNEPIPISEFEAHLSTILPHLMEALAADEPDRYLSPTGVFLTVALSWFKPRLVDWYVIEGGRGVQADEIGQL